LTREHVTDVARALNVPAARVEGVASFYSMLSRHTPPRQTLRMCDGIVCRLHGALECRAAAERAAANRPGWTVERCSCLGLCERAPAGYLDGRQIGPVDGDRIEALFDDVHPGSRDDDLPSVPAAPRAGEQRLVLQRCGRIDPRSIAEALAAGAYTGLGQALEHSPESVITAVEAAGLRGRGGAGFPTGRKWRTVAQAPDLRRYVIGNADESEPLMFKDRVLLECDPHAVLEGLAIAAYAVGAREGFLYVRGEYEPQAQLLEHAIAQAEAAGRLGDRIGGTEFSFRVHVHRGAGAYVCGEESALLESLEGRRGEPRVRPPFPAQAGYHGHPTVVNNVETLAVAAAILRIGADAYRAIGNPDTPGTRLFTLLGHVGRPGLVEVPFGLTLRQMIDELAGGMRPGSAFHLALTAGAAGTIVSGRHLDVPLDYDAGKHGVAVGSGGILACDASISPVWLLRELLHFFEHESCGKCTPCRIGTAECRRICDRLLSRSAEHGDLERLRQTAALLKQTSLCGLGTSTADPINSALDNFPDAFEELAS
jgi:NADH:ubiquinone oxidoreductase subunit F (NADH-binding)